MNNRLYRDARRAFVSAATAYRIACDDDAPRDYAFGAYPECGETIERDGIRYRVKIESDEPKRYRPRGNGCLTAWFLKCATCSSTALVGFK